MARGGLRRRAAPRSGDMGGREREDLGDGARRIAATCRLGSGDTKAHEYKRLGADAGEERGDGRGDARARAARSALPGCAG
jgi:hypothetical protein